MFNLGFPELILLGIIGLLVIGPKQLPAVAKSLARMFNELKSVKKDLTDSLSKVQDETAETLQNLSQDVLKKTEIKELKEVGKELYSLNKERKGEDSE